MFIQLHFNIFRDKTNGMLTRFAEKIDSFEHTGDNTFPLELLPCLSMSNPLKSFVLLPAISHA